MKNEKHTKTDDILGSLDGMKRMPAPDFFYTRLKARMSSIEDSNETTAVTKWLLRPALAMLVLLLAVNSFMLLQKNKDNSSGEGSDDQLSIASAYQLNDNLLYDINQEK